MLIVSVPDVVILKPVDIDVQTVGIDVHVGNEIVQNTILTTAFFRIKIGCILFETSKSTSILHQLDCFSIFEKYIHSFVTPEQQNSRLYFSIILILQP